MKSRNNAREAKRAQRVLHDMLERDALGHWGREQSPLFPSQVQYAPLPLFMGEH